jgi:hypothetical protein
MLFSHEFLPESSGREHPTRAAAIAPLVLKNALRVKDIAIV